MQNKENVSKGGHLWGRSFWPPPGGGQLFGHGYVSRCGSLIWEGFFYTILTTIPHTMCRHRQESRVASGRHVMSEMEIMQSFLSFSSVGWVNVKVRNTVAELNARHHFLSKKNKKREREDREERATYSLQRQTRYSQLVAMIRMGN